MTIGSSHEVIASRETGVKMSGKKPGNEPASSAKGPNHELSALACPRHAHEVDLFSGGAQEHWYEAYPL